jgi:hypothetical protein
MTPSSRRLARVRPSLPRRIARSRARPDYRNVITMRENNSRVGCILERSYDKVPKNVRKWETTFGVFANYLIRQAFVFVAYFS